MTESIDSLESRYAVLSITGSGKFETVSNALQLQPSEAWNHGDFDEKQRITRNGMTWRLEPGNRQAPLDQQIDTLLSILSVRSEQIKELWLDYDLMLLVLIETSNAHIPFSLDREKCRQVARLGLSLDLDIYAHDV